MWRSLLPVVVLAGCAVDDGAPTPSGPDPFETVWADSLQAGDLIAMVPGTKAYDYLGKTLDALPDAEPVVDVRAVMPLADDAIVFEQAIAAAHRAGLSDAQLEAGAVAFGLWGAGFTRVKAFTYVSWEHLHIRVAVLGGTNTCATGDVATNLLNYTVQNADTDATNLYTDLQAWLAVHPASNVVLASHSWGGGIAEWLVAHRDAIAAKQGALGAALPFAIAAGVPGYMVGYQFAGPGFRSIGDIALYEVDRPDDPVHAMDPSGNPDGHQYDIVFGDAFQGAYGLTTTALSCRNVAGPCLHD